MCNWDYSKLINWLDFNSVANFFIIFSRFEYSLKRLNYITRNNDNKVSADWDKYFLDNWDTILRYFNVNDEKINFFINSKPKKQIINNDKICWKYIERNTIIEKINYNLRTIRNNLFHWGKYSDEPVEELSRNNELIKSSIHVLNLLIENDENIKNYFYEI